MIKKLISLRGFCLSYVVGPVVKIFALCIALFVGGKDLHRVFKLLIGIDRNFHPFKAVIFVKRLCLSGILIDLPSLNRFLLRRILHQDLCCFRIIHLYGIVNDHGKGMVIQIIAGGSFGFFCVVSAVIKICALCVSLMIRHQFCYGHSAGRIGIDRNFHPLKAVAVIKGLALSGIRIKLLNFHRFLPGLILKKEISLIGCFSVNLYAASQHHREGMIINVIALRSGHLPKVIGAVLKRAADRIAICIGGKCLHQGAKGCVRIDPNLHAGKGIAGVISLRLPGCRILFLDLDLFGRPRV